MASRLADWYDVLEIPILPEQLELRQAGLEACVDEAIDDADLVEELISLFFSAEPSDDFFKRLANRFQKHDPTFSENRKRELSLLAGAILHDIVINHDDEDRFLIQAQFLMYIFLGNYGSIKNISDEIANSFIHDTAIYREKIIEDETAEAVAKLKISFKSTEDEEINYDETAIEKLDAIVSSLNQLIGNYSRTKEELENKVNLLRDDTQILWWLLGGYADIRNKKYADLKPEEAAYLAGHGLAKRVTQYPGPYSADVMLKHVLEGCQQTERITIGDFVDGIGDDLIEDHSDETPLLTALKMKKEVGIGNWHKPLKTRFGMDITKTYTLVDLAYEIYIEKMYVDSAEG